MVIPVSCSEEKFLQLGIRSARQYHIVDTNWGRKDVELSHYDTELSADDRYSYNILDEYEVTRSTVSRDELAFDDEKPTSSLQFLSLGSISFDFPWLESFYEISQVATRASDLLPMVNGVTQLLTQQKDREVDNLLRNINLNRLGLLSKVALIRITYPAKHRLEYWQDALERIQVSIEKQGESSEFHLRGIV